MLIFTSREAYECLNLVVRSFEATMGTVIARMRSRSLGRGLGGDLGGDLGGHLGRDLGRDLGGGLGGGLGGCRGDQNALNLSCVDVHPHMIAYIALTLAAVIIAMRLSMRDMMRVRTTAIQLSGVFMDTVRVRDVSVT
jgi:hypothetical protein